MNEWLIRAVCVALLAGLGYPRETIEASPQAQPTSALKITPTALTFSPQLVDTASPAQSISLANHGNSDLQIGDIFPSGIDFAATNTCGASLAGGASCTIAVTFKPAIPGPRLGSISIVASGQGSPRLVTLSGTGQE